MYAGGCKPSSIISQFIVGPVARLHCGVNVKVNNNSKSSNNTNKNSNSSSSTIMVIVLIITIKVILGFMLLRLLGSCGFGILFVSVASRAPL